MEMFQVTLCHFNVGIFKRNQHHAWNLIKQEWDIHDIVLRSLQATTKQNGILNT